MEIMCLYAKLRHHQRDNSLSYLYYMPYDYQVIII